MLERVMLAFEGEGVPRWVSKRLAEAPAAGMTVFLHHNVRSPGQLRELTEAFQRAGGAVGEGHEHAPSPMLVAADQEGGQLVALGHGSTPFAGNMALGAVGDDDLAARVGAAIGLEARAMGVNVVYAPVIDLASEPHNTAIGVRSFGDDPAAVAHLGAAMIRGLQGVGVAAAIKHFPGLGEVAQDTHHALGVVDATRDDLEAGAFAPFRAGVSAGVRLAMTAHVAVPALTGDRTLPATLSRTVLTDLLRDEMGFGGLTISDALDMRALAQGAAQAVDVIAAVRAGVDLLLCSADQRAQRRIEETLVAGARRGLFEPEELAASSERLRELRSWLGAAGPQPDIDVVGSATHVALARELAERSITLVRAGGAVAAGDDAAFIPLPADATILAIMPQPTDLTPADTSSTVAPGLGRALRTRFATVDEVVVDVAPSDADIAALRARAGAFDAVVLGTLDALRQPGQAALVAAVVGTGTRTIAVALRTPWDMATYPVGITAIATYSILPPSLAALAAALAGAIPFRGHVPVRLDQASAR